MEDAQIEMHKALEQRAEEAGRNRSYNGPQWVPETS
jgi:hypothetical protein